LQLHLHLWFSGGQASKGKVCRQPVLKAILKEAESNTCKVSVTYILGSAST